MSKIYASFSTPAQAEKAAGALLDYGVNSDDISLVRSGNEDDYNNWMSSRTSDQPDMIGTQYDETGYAGTSESGTAGSMMGTNPGTYGNAMNEDVHLRAANRIDNTEYVDELAREDSGVRENDYDTKNDDATDVSAKSGISTTTPADAGVGAAKGAGVGLGIGILAALASVFVPGFGLILGGGALAAAIGGAVATTGAGAIAGAVTGYLKDQGVEEAVARDYEATLNSGGALLEVNVPSGEVDEFTAKEVMNKYGAVNIGTYAGRGYVA